VIITEAPSFIKTYVEDLNNKLEKHQPGARLTLTQRTWLSFCLTGILMVNAVCWAKLERASLGNYKLSALSWMFRKSKISWEYLLIASVRLILKSYGITGGILVLDESDRSRSKNTKRIHKAHKQKHKASGGYINGQTVVLLLLVTDSITVPVGFKFYMPDPAVSAWNKEEEKLKKREFPRVSGRLNRNLTQSIRQRLNWDYSCSKILKDIILKLQLNVYWPMPYMVQTNL